MTIPLTIEFMHTTSFHIHNDSYFFKSQRFQIVTSDIITTDHLQMELSTQSIILSSQLGLIT